MKLFLVAGFLLGAAAPAIACNPDMLVVQGWEAIANEGNKFFPVDLSATVAYEGEKSFRMIHAGVMFADALGRGLGQVNLDEDQHAADGDILIVDGYVSADERLLNINHDDIVARACVWSIVYEDGTVEKFE